MTLENALFALMVLNAAISGFGIAHLPCFLGDAEEMLTRLTPEVFHNRRVLMVVHPDVARLGRVRAVMNFLVELLPIDGDLFAGRRARRGSGPDDGPDGV